MISKKFKIETNENSLIKLPADYSTDNEQEKKVVDLINDIDSNSWEKKYDENKVQIYTKVVPNSEFLMVKTISTIPYPLKTVKTALDDKIVREKWDKTNKNIDFFDTKQLDENTTEGIYYCEMVFPFPLSNRDFVQKQIVIKNYGGIPDAELRYSNSTTHPSKPEKSKPVRAQILLSGEYFLPISESECRYYIISWTDIKMMKKLQNIVNSKTVDSSKDYIVNLIKGCSNVK